MAVQDHAERARELFESGCNCPQSVVLAFADVLEQEGLEPTTVARLASPFGGGMGRLREVCGAMSGMLMVLGLLEGYDDPQAYDAKKELYATVQELAGKFKGENGSYLCRELLGLEEGPDVSVPEVRTEAYYERRPCADIVAAAAGILEEHLNGRE